LQGSLDQSSRRGAKLRPGGCNAGTEIVDPHKFGVLYAK
jgi:hypothetical protein